MERHTTARAAWEDFYEWVRHQPIWAAMPKAERKRIYDAQADYKGVRGKALGDKRIRSLLEKYAPDRYEFRDIVIIHE